MNILEHLNNFRDILFCKNKCKRTQFISDSIDKTTNYNNKKYDIKDSIILFSFFLCALTAKQTSANLYQCMVKNVGFDHTLVDVDIRSLKLLTYQL